MGFSGVCLLLFFAAVSIEATIVTMGPDGSIRDPHPVVFPQKPLMRRMPNSSLGSLPSSMKVTISSAVIDAHSDETMLQKEAPAAPRCIRKCSKNKKAWSQKCKWNKCKGCGECSRAATTTVPAATTPTVISTTKDNCFAFTQRRDCVYNSCGWSDSACKSCTAFTQATCPPANKGCKWANSRCTPEAQIQFGGLGHRMGARGARLRPEVVRSEICLGGKCTECTDRATCWRGHRGWNYVQVPANSPPGDRAHTIEIECKDVGGRWTVLLAGSTSTTPEEQLINGEIDVFFDGVKLPKLTTTGIPPTSCKTKSGICTERGVPQTLPVTKGNHKLHVVLRVTDPTKAASAGVKAVAYVDPWVDTCFTSHVCLNMLGDGSDASFRMRNSNKKQRECAEERSAAEDQAKCGEWKNCMVSHDHAQSTRYFASLKKLLRASQSGKASALIQKLEVDKRSESGECIDPEHADPEAFECECLADFQSACAGATNEEACFKNLMCAHTSVCSSWKQANCPSLLSLMDERGTDNGTAGITISNSLDSATTGKCTM